MDYSKIAKILLILSILLAAFFAGLNYERAIKNAEISDLKREYAQASEVAQRNLIEEYNAKQTELENALSEARSRESDARAKSNELQQRIDKLKSTSKTPHSRFAIRSLETLRKCKAIIDRDTTIIEYCRAALQ